MKSENKDINKMVDYQDELELYRNQLMDDEDIAFMHGLDYTILPPPEEEK